MLQSNVKKVLEQINPQDVVLDVGGGAQPFSRANYVIDISRYDERGSYANIGLPARSGAELQNYSADTWVQRDACDRIPFPFEDKFFDFVVCSHFLEDVRDPLWICSEIIRIGKRGYIEVPSRLSESIMDPATGIVGASHHRWFVEISDNKIEFLFKSHLVHKAGCHLPAYVGYLLKEQDCVQSLFWEKNFEYLERFLFSNTEIEKELVDWARAHAPETSAAKALYLSAKIHMRNTLPKPLISMVQSIQRRSRQPS